MKRKELLIVLGVVCLVIAGFGCYNFLRNNNVTSGEKIIKYEEDLLGISFSKYVEKATGEIHRTSGQEDYAKAIFAINSNKKDELERELKEKMNYDDRDLYKDYFGKLKSGYYDIWFERTATDWGTWYIEKVEKISK